MREAPATCRRESTGVAGASQGILTVAVTLLRSPNGGEGEEVTGPLGGLLRSARGPVGGDETAGTLGADGLLETLR